MMSRLQKFALFWHFFHQSQRQIAYSTRINCCSAHLRKKNIKKLGNHVLWWVRIISSTVPITYLNFQVKNGRATKNLIEFYISSIFQAVSKKSYKVPEIGYCAATQNRTVNSPDFPHLIVRSWWSTVHCWELTNNSGPSTLVSSRFRLSHLDGPDLSTLA